MEKEKRKKVGIGGRVDVELHQIIKRYCLNDRRTMSQAIEIILEKGAETMGLK